MPPPPSRFRPEAVLFDCDGTLLLTAELHFEAMAEAARRQGLTMPRDWYLALTGLGRRDTYLQLVQDFGGNPDLSRLMSDSIGLTVALAHCTQANPAVRDLAAMLAGRMPLAVVTNSEAVIAHAFLRAAGLLSLFDTVVTVEDAARPKPAPDLYLTAAARLGVTPDRCLVLEDSAQGLAAGAAAGAVCLDVRGITDPAVLWPGPLPAPAGVAPD